MVRRITEQIRNLFRKPGSIIPGQRSFDSSVGFINSQIFYAALKREERLHTYDYLYNNIPIVDGAISILTGLANTPLRADTGDATLDNDVSDILDSIGIDELNPQIDRMLLVFGFAAVEYVLTDDESGLDKLVVLPSIETRFRVNPQGDIVKVIQLPRTRVRTATNTFQSNMIEIPPEKCLILQRNKMGLTSHYGRSLFQTAVTSIDALSQIFDAQLKIYKRFGEPRYVIEVDNTIADSEERYREMLEQVADLFEKGGDNRNILGPPGLKASIIGAEGSALRWKDETNLVVSNILAPTGIPSSLLNYNVGGVTESYSRQQVLVMTAIIRNLQRLKAQAYTRKLMPILSAVYGLPEIKRLKFEPPRLLEQLQEEQAREQRRATDWMDAVDGLISPESFALRQGVSNVADLENLRERIEQARTTQSETDKESPDDLGNTKGTDQSLSTSKAI